MAEQVVSERPMAEHERPPREASTRDAPKGLASKRLITGASGPADVTRAVCGPLERRPTALWHLAFVVAASALLLGVVCVTYQIMVGIGTWGLNRTVGWAFDITNFVFWVGIGHAGTLISAVLLLMRQRWRTSINRSAEAMTIFAVMCAGLFPLIHMGRPWLAYWVFPYPNMRGSLWVNFRSPLLWDVFAIGTYFTISLVFWYIGMVPDLATLRDRARGLRRRVLGFFALRWDGGARTWSRWEMACLLLAALATPLVVSVHSVVSTDFATAVVPGWHTTVFPPYFVIGAVFSGFAMVLTLMLVARKVMALEGYITWRHIHAMCKVLVFTGSIVGLAYATELFMAWYSGSPYEQFAFNNRMRGPMGWAYGLMVLCNVVAPQLLWFRRVRNSILAIFLLSLAVNVGMWFERFVIIVVSLGRDFLPSSWSDYAPTWIELGTLVGSFGLFFTCFLIFCRFLPMIAMAEVKAVVEEEGGGARGHEVEPAPVPVALKAAPGATNGAMNGRARTPGLVHLGMFGSASAMLGAAREARGRGLAVVDTHTPHPVHGLDAVLGLRRSRLPFVTLVCGAVGLVIALGFQYWASSSSWPLDVGGKPFDSLPAFVPVAFEVTVLLAGLGTAAALLIRSRLRPGNGEPVAPAGATDDRYVLALRRHDASLDDDAIESMWSRHGALEVWTEYRS
jgi:molybdopterin-containing oxidoreductase family membrane subunit